MIDFLSLSLTDLRSWLEAHSFPSFQAEQLFTWVYDRGERRWEAMTNVSAPLREALAKAFRLSVLKQVKEKAGLGGVTKFQWQLIDKSFVEAVMTPGRQGWNLTLSTQVGCPVGCIFCASGKRGFVRNLQPAEIIEQFLIARQWVRDRGSKDIGHVSFDGMGEPLKNVKSLVTAIEALCDPQKIGIKPRKITVSTVGVIEGIERLLQAKIPVNLTVGLHASNQRTRQKLTPYAKRNRIGELLDICRRYSMQMGMPVTFDYVMINGINEHPDTALELAHLVKQLRCQVRIVPYHPIPGFHLTPPSKKAIKAFRSVLFGNKIANTLYEGKGMDIQAALGQLALQGKANSAAAKD